METIDIEKMVADEFEAQDPNHDEFVNTNEHFSKIVEGVESIIQQFRANGTVEVGGCEAYAIGMMKANGMNWNIQAGYENFVTENAKKLYEMIVNMLKRIKDYFFGNSGSDNLNMEDTAKVIDSKEAAIEKAADARSADDIMEKGVVLSSAELAVALTTEAPKLPAVVNTINDERNLTVIEVRHSLRTESKEIQTLLENKGHKTPSEQQKVIRAAIADRSVVAEIQPQFDGAFGDRKFSLKYQKSDTVAAAALRSIQTRLDSYLAFVKSKEEELPGDFGQWTGWFTIQRDIEKGHTGDAMSYLLHLCKDGSDMERAITRDTAVLDKTKSKLEGHSEAGIINAIMQDIAVLQQVLSRECNVAAECKTSQRKVKKALNRQIEAIEKARAKLVVSAVKAHLKA